MTKCYKDEKQAPKKSRYWSVNSELNCANLSLREKVDLNLTTSSPLQLLVLARLPLLEMLFSRLNQGSLY